MSKSEVTLNLEKKIYKKTNKKGIFRCFEVTIGFGGKERVDFITIDTKNIVRCYEIKSSVADFRSKCKHTFIGHYNYFVMSNELFEKVKDEIPNNIGVSDGTYIIKNAKKQKLKVSLQVILSSMVRSLSRDADKWNKISQTDSYQKNRKEINRLRRENTKNRKELNEYRINSQKINRFMRNNGIKEKFNDFMEK